MSCYDGLLETQNTDYKLRDIGPAGGLIFYVNPDYEKDGWRYLEAAPYDQPGQPWGSNIFFVPGADETAIGSGNQNTIDIVNGDSNPTAADVCYDLTLNGYNDWFLPSRDELELMCWNLRGVKYNTIYNPDVPNAAVVGLGGFVLSQYWSSSEASDVDSIIVNFSDGQVFPATKMGGYHIRPIRAF